MSESEQLAEQMENDYFVDLQTIIVGGMSFFEDEKNLIKSTLIKAIECGQKLSSNSDAAA